MTDAEKPAPGDAYAIYDSQGRRHELNCANDERKQGGEWHSHFPEPAPPSPQVETVFEVRMGRRGATWNRCPTPEESCLYCEAHAPFVLRSALEAERRMTKSQERISGHLKDALAAERRATEEAKNEYSLARRDLATAIRQLNETQRELTAERRARKQDNEHSSKVLGETCNELVDLQYALKDAQRELTEARAALGKWQHAHNIHAFGSTAPCPNCEALKARIEVLFDALAAPDAPDVSQSAKWYGEEVGNAPDAPRTDAAVSPWKVGDLDHVPGEECLAGCPYHKRPPVAPEREGCDNTAANFDGTLEPCTLPQGHDGWCVYPIYQGKKP